MREVFEGIECRAQNPTISGFDMNIQKNRVFEPAIISKDTIEMRTRAINKFQFTVS